MKGIVALILIFCLCFTAGAIKFKSGSDSFSDEEDKTQEVEDQGGDIEDTEGVLEKLKDANGGVDLINPWDNLGADLPTRSEWNIAIAELDLDDAPESIKAQVRAENNMLKDGKSTYLAGAESLLAWAYNQAANELGRGDLFFTTATQDNEQNTPAAAMATVGEEDFACHEWKPSSDRDELGTISALGKEENLTIVQLFPPLVKKTGESDD